MVQYLCKQGADKEARDEYGGRPRHLAAYEGHLPVLQYLCEQGADIDAKGTDGYGPLHFAAVKGHLFVVQCLCEQGANMDDTTLRRLRWLKHIIFRFYNILLQRAMISLYLFSLDPPPTLTIASLLPTF